MRLVAALLLFALGGLGVACAQSRESLAEYLKAHPWDSAHDGAMLVIDPAGVEGPAQAGSLGAFERVKKTVGDLTAIAPTQMVAIDDTFQQMPNMDDGLDPYAKVLCLLSTLTDDQWKVVLRGGIGMSDLQGDQQKIFASILPKTFTWHSFTTDGLGNASPDTDGGTLSAQDLSGVKLYLSKQIALAARLQGASNRYVFPKDVDLPNTTVFARDSRTDARHDLFGMVIRNSVPNDFKRSDLEYGRLAARVKLAPQTTVREALAQIGSASGVELHADLRVADRPLWFFGEDAKAGNVLKAIALAVTGTYRRVGSAYVLTSDLMGMGERKDRFSLWADALMHDEQQKVALWDHAIGTKGQIFNAAFDPNDPAIPNDSIYTKEDDEAPSPTRWIPVAQLTPGLQQKLRLTASTPRAMKIDDSGAMLMAQYTYGFVLPTGQRLQKEASFGGAYQFKRPSLPNAAIGFASEARGPVPVKGAQSILAAAPKSASDAKRYADLAAKKSVPELWVETNDSSVLAAAIQAATADGLKIRLMVHPWSGQTPNEAADRTILGATGAQVVDQELQSPLWSSDHNSADWIGAWEQPAISPTDGQAASRWAEIARLAKTSGLGGVVLMQTAPPGYEGHRNPRGGSPGQNMFESVEYGYTPEQRLAFLRANEADPIDIVSKLVRFRLDLREPFFPDDALRGATPSPDEKGAANPALDQLQGKWDAYRGGLNQKAIADLVGTLESEGVSVMMEKRNALANMSASRRVLAPVTAGQELPTEPGELRGGIVDLHGSIVYYDASDPARPAPYPSGDVTSVIGFGNMSPADAEEMLNKILG